MKDTVEPLAKVYSLKTPLRILCCFLYLLLAFIGFQFIILLVEILQNHSFDNLFFWLLGLGLMAFFLYATALMWNIRLELSSEGVTYINPAYYRIYTPWENITQIATEACFPANVILMLRTPATRNITFLEGKRQRLAVIERCFLLTTKADLIHRAFFIPLRGLVPKKDLENGILNAYLQQYVPHLSHEITTF